MEELLSKYRQFIKERNWEQFHNPKNLAATLSVEASELLELYQNNLNNRFLPGIYRMDRKS